MNHRCPLHAACVLCLLAISGCAWRSMWVPQPQPLAAPPAFYGAPTAEEIVHFLNTNSSRVSYLQSDGARVSVPGVPALRASLAMQPPSRFRFRADTPFTGPELDLGSNDEVFWIWIRRNKPAAVYFASHDQFRQSQIGQALPIQPRWLSETLGLVRLEPQDQLEGPFPRNDGKLEARVRSASSPGTIKVLVLDATYGWLAELHTYNHQGQLLASAVASRHRFYPLGSPQQGVSLPHHIDVQLPTAQLTFQLDIDYYRVNPPQAGNPQLWTVPQIEGFPQINVANLSPDSMTSQAARPSIDQQPGPRAGVQLRGYNRR